MEMVCIRAFFRVSGTIWETQIRNENQSCEGLLRNGQKIEVESYETKR